MCRERQRERERERERDMHMCIHMYIHTHTNALYIVIGMFRCPPIQGPTQYKLTCSYLVLFSELLNLKNATQGYDI